MNEPNLLVVDDIFVNRLLLSEIIKRNGAKCECVNNGKEAVEKVENSEFDMVLMDIEMPIMNGFEATKNIRSMSDTKKSNIPIVALSAHNINDFSEEFHSSGFNDFLSKPYSAQKIHDIIVEFCKKSK